MNTPTFQPGDTPEDQYGRIEFNNINPRPHGNTMEAMREYQQKKNMPELERIYRDHPSLYDLTKNNAEVYAWFKMAAIGACTVEEALIGCVVRLAEGNRNLFDQVVSLEMSAKNPFGYGRVKLSPPHLKDGE